MLDGMFNVDNPLFRVINRIADMVVLNVLFLVSCIPIVTIGPALTAMYYVAINAWSREDGYIFRMYKKSFKENFKQSTIMWLILLVVGFVLSVDVWFWVSQWKLTRVGMYKPFIVISVILLVVYLLIFTYVWPIQAKFTNSIKGTIKNAFALMITHVPETLALWLIFAAAAFTVYLVSVARIAVFFIGFSLVAYLQALIYRHIFKPYLKEEEHLTPEEEAGLVGYENSYADSKIQVAKLAEEMAAKQAEKEEAVEEEVVEKETSEAETVGREVSEEEKSEIEQSREEDAKENAPAKRSIKDIIAATSNPAGEEEGE
ncbi:MAG: YesL family protein [Lachnospiraceae bacterium]